MRKGRITIPTDENYIEGTKKIADLWGADAVRDCDGVKLPKNPKEIAEKVYNVYFVDRGNHEWAANNPDEWQHMFIMTPFVTATEETLSVRLMDTFYAEQLKPDFTADGVKHMEVMDRTTGQVHTSWRADEEGGCVVIENAVPFHQYTVAFLGISLWHPVHMYNYITNNWDEPHHIMYDPYYPKTKKFIRENLQRWCDENPESNVVRFTTFLYMFSLVFNQYGKERNVDWFGYNMAVSPRMLDDFEKEYGYKMRAEYLVDAGYYNQTHRIPTKEYKDWMKFVQNFVTETVKDLVEITHKNGKEAMMFLGDCWIGAEIFGERYKELNLDALVGSVGGGVTVRMLSDVEGVKYKEGRFLPYFFPDTFFEGNEENAVEELNNNWITARRAMMRNPLDRIGFGGYLELAAKFPKFINRAAEICDEFRYIYDTVKTQTPKNFAKVAVLNAWGKVRSWMCNMTAHELWYQQSYSYQGIYEALSGMPVDVQFINFDDVKNGRLSEFDVVINAGDAGTAWSGGENWADEKVVTEVRKFVYNGGGFIGVGEPTAIQRNGKFFQLSDVLGVDKECGISLGEDKYNIEKHGEHFILDGIETSVDYGEDKKNIFALDGANVVDIVFSDRFTRKVNVGEVKMATNVYGKGRSFYITGLPYSANNAKLLYRAILWTAGKEDMDKKSYCANPLTEAHFYGDRYAVINNTDKEQTTTFYDMMGDECQLVLKPYEIRWIEAKRIRINDDIVNNSVSAQNQIDKKIKIVEAENPALKVLFLGNSITLHGIAPSIGWHGEWGMAASCAENDYVHRVVRSLNKTHGAVSYCVVNVAEWEWNFADESMLQFYSKAKDFNADVVVVRLGENVDRELLKTEDFPLAFEKFLRYFSETAKQVVVTDTFWEYEPICTPLKDVAKKVGATFVSVCDLGYADENKATGKFEHAGVASHPGDLGMQRMAERILEKIKD